LARCTLCGKDVGWNEKKYKFDGDRIFCLDCMTCSICGSKARGETRGIVGVQPFCERCYEQAKVEMEKTVDKLTDKYLEIKLNALKFEKDHYQMRMESILSTHRKLTMAQRFLSPLSAINGALAQQQMYQEFKDKMGSFDAEIANIERILTQRKEQKHSPPATESATEQNPITILKIRFAKGEITKEEYEQMKKTLEPELS